MGVFPVVKSHKRHLSKPRVKQKFDSLRILVKIPFETYNMGKGAEAEPENHDENQALTAGVKWVSDTVEEHGKLENYESLARLEVDYKGATYKAGRVKENLTFPMLRAIVFETLANAGVTLPPNVTGSYFDEDEQVKPLVSHTASLHKSPSFDQLCSGMGNMENCEGSLNRGGSWSCGTLIRIKLEDLDEQNLDENEVRLRRWSHSADERSSFAEEQAVPVA